MLGTIQDITERKTAEAIRMRMSRLESIGILAGGIAHDFNNLLSVIVSNVFLAKMRLNREDPALQDLEDAEEALQQASELSSRFLTFSKGGEPFRRPTSVAKLIVESSKFLAAYPLISFRCDISDNIRQVLADERQIELAMRNLLANAQESMPNGGTVTVSAKNLDVEPDNDLNLDENNYVEISVADEGVGIPEENLTRIFDPYFTTKDLWSQKGMGMGLAICHSLTRKHGGNITAESGLGKGTIMRLFLPAVVP
jgi:signal transduction histidine kinase